jgi:hypothetical protein
MPHASKKLPKKERLLRRPKNSDVSDVRAREYLRPAIASYT